MKDFKNYIIAILTGLLALSLFTQPAQSAPAKNSPVSLTQADLIKIAESVPFVSVEEQTKLIEYDRCLDRYNTYYAKDSVNLVTVEKIFSYCIEHKP